MWSNVVLGDATLAKLSVTTCQNSNNKGNFVPEANHGVVSLLLVLPDNFSAFSHAPEREKGKRKNNGGWEGDDFAFLVSISRSCTVSSNKLVSLPHIPAAYITVERVYVRFPLGLGKGPKQFLCSHRTERASLFRTLHVSIVSASVPGTNTNFCPRSLSLFVLTLMMQRECKNKEQIFSTEKRGVQFGRTNATFYSLHAPSGDQAAFNTVCPRNYGC